MTNPIVSIIIPCGPKHGLYLPQALASCQWQTVGEWEAIVINDTGGPLEVPSHVRVLPGHRNVSRNRNAGLAVAQGAFVVCLDADDYLLPDGLATLLRAYASHDAGYIYSDCYTLDDAGHIRHARAPDYSQDDVARRNLHTVTALAPTECLRQVGGFDERVDIWEDWTPWLRLAQAGICGQRIEMPTFVYRTGLGDRRATGFAGDNAYQRELMDRVLRHYRDETGQIPMAGCGCGGKARTAAQAMAQRLPDPGATVMNDGRIKMEFTGTEPGTQSFRMRDGTLYRGGNNASNRYAFVQPYHQEEFLQRYGHLWRVAPPMPTPVAPPDLGAVDDSEVPPVLPPYPNVVSSTGEPITVAVNNEVVGDVRVRGPGRPRKVGPDAS